MFAVGYCTSEWNWPVNGLTMESTTTTKKRQGLRAPNIHPGLNCFVAWPMLPLLVMRCSSS